MPDPPNVYVTLTGAPPNDSIPPNRIFAAVAMPPPQYCENEANPPPPCDGVPPHFSGLGQAPPQPPTPAPTASASMPGKSPAGLIHPCATNNKRRLSRYGLSTLLLTLCHLTRSDSHGCTRFLPRLLCRVPHASAYLPRPPTPSPTSTTTTTSTTTSCRNPSPSLPTTPLRASRPMCLAKWLRLHHPRHPRHVHHPLHQRRVPPL